MKKRFSKIVIAVSLMLISCCESHAQDTTSTSKSDTTIIGEESILIIEEKEDGDDKVTITLGGISINIGEDDKVEIKRESETFEVDGKSIRLSRKKRKKVQTHFLTGFDMGVANFTPDENVPDRFEALSSSTDVHWHLVAQRYNFTPNFSFKWGIDFNWRNYRFSDDLRFVKDKNTGVYHSFIDSTVSYSKNKLMARYLMIPLMLELHTANLRSWKTMGLAIGASFGQLLGGKQKLISPEYGKQKFRENFGFSPQRIDAIAKISIGRVTLYGNYGITPMFKDVDVDFATNYIPYSIGLQLLGF